MRRVSIVTLALAIGCGSALLGCATAPAPEGASSPLPRGPEAAVPTPSPSPRPAPASPMPTGPGATVGSTVSGGVIRSTSNGRGAPLDTLPGPDAKAVLKTIPEPLPAGERVPPRSSPSPTSTTETPVSDSTAAAADTSQNEADVPVPEPTRPLGDRPRPAVSDTTAAAPSPSPTPVAPKQANPSPSKPARPDTCWRVQFAAVPEANRADRLRIAAESQLDVHCVVEKQKKLYRVRTHDCQSGSAADLLRKRAIAVGFSGAFRFRDHGP